MLPPNAYLTWQGIFVIVQETNSLMPALQMEASAEPIFTYFDMLPYNQAGLNSRLETIRYRKYGF